MTKQTLFSTTASALSATAALSGFGVGSQALNASNLTTTADLKVDCTIEATVTSAEAYFVDNSGTRALSYAGVKGSVEVESIEGADCSDLPLYGIDLSVGDSIAFDNSFQGSFDEALQQADEALGQTWTSPGKQTFVYANPTGELPLFPTIHAENLSYFGLKGSLDAESVYGSLPPTALNLAQSQALADTILRELSYGLVWKNIAYNTNPAYELYLKTWITLAEKRVSQGQAEDLLNDALLMFSNSTSSSYNIHYLSPQFQVASTILSVIGTQGDADWLKLAKAYPLLFSETVLFWNKVSAPESLPSLSDESLLELLNEVYAASELIVQLPQLGAGRILLVQYQKLAKGISVLKGNQGLTAAQQELVEAILGQTF